MQDAERYDNKAITYANAPILPNDVLRINVNALIPESTIPYNKVSNNTGNASVNVMQLDGYLVSENLTINFPVLGVLSVAEMTTQEFAMYLKNKLESEGHLKNPSVDVRLVNAKVTILGEVKQPGTFNFTEQNITLLQALGYAGDLTINGKRDDILIMRDDNGIRKISHIDLTASDWLESEFYYLKPNDMIVVNQNGPKVKSAGFVGNVGTFLSVFSIILTTVVLITK